MKDRNGQTVDVEREWHRTSMTLITINKGKPDERTILLDSAQTRELIKDLTDTL